jgi:hypothetical protein
MTTSSVQLLWPLTRGTTILFHSERDADLGQLIKDHDVTFLQIDVAMLSRCLPSVSPGNGAALRTVRAVLCTNGILTRSLALEFTRLFKGDFSYSYGLAEALGPITLQQDRPGIIQLYRFHWKTRSGLGLRS